jgi:hypothetical protein
MAKEFSQRPSSFLAIDDGWVAYMVDEAVWAFGRTVQNRYDETDDQGRRKHTLEWCLGEAKPAGVEALAGIKGLNVRVRKKKLNHRDTEGTE